MSSASPHEVRLRHGAVRGLHGAARRTADPLVCSPVAALPGRKSPPSRQLGKRRPASRCSRRAGLEVVQCGYCQSARSCRPPRCSRRTPIPATPTSTGYVGQHLPLRDLPSHPRRDQAGRERSLTDVRTHRIAPRLRGGAHRRGGGLLLGCRVGDRSGTATVPPRRHARLCANAFIRIGTDGRVTLVMNQVEMGQGAYTSMPMLMRKSSRWGWTRSSSSTLRPTTSSTPTRSSAIKKRWIVVGARVLRAVTTRGSDRAHDARGRRRPDVGRRSDVVSGQAGRGDHTPSGRTLGYGAWPKKRANYRAGQGRAQGSKDFALIGTPAKRLDAPDKVNGKAQYGIDVRLPE